MPTTPPRTTTALTSSTNDSILLKNLHWISLRGYFVIVALLFAILVSIINFLSTIIIGVEKNNSSRSSKSRSSAKEIGHENVEISGHSCRIKGRAATTTTAAATVSRSLEQNQRSSVVALSTRTLFIVSFIVVLSFVGCLLLDGLRIGSFEDYRTTAVFVTYVIILIIIVSWSKQQFGIELDYDNNSKNKDNRISRYFCCH